eukprot:scaffold34606_cov192-Amphora_coffeaeformis.AAC.3
MGYERASSPICSAVRAIPKDPKQDTFIHFNKNAANNGSAAPAAMVVVCSLCFPTTKPLQGLHKLRGRACEGMSPWKPTFCAAVVSKGDHGVTNWMIPLVCPD